MSSTAADAARSVRVPALHEEPWHQELLRRDSGVPRRLPTARSSRRVYDASPDPAGDTVERAQVCLDDCPDMPMRKGFGLLDAVGAPPAVGCTGASAADRAVPARGVCRRPSRGDRFPRAMVIASGRWSRRTAPSSPSPPRWRSGPLDASAEVALAVRAMIGVVVVSWPSGARRPPTGASRPPIGDHLCGCAVGRRVTDV